MNDVKVTYGGKAMQDADYAVSQAIGSWQKAYKAVQVALVSITANLYNHRDTDTTVKRIMALIEGTEGANHAAMVEWLVQMGFKVTEDGIQSCPDNATIEEKAGRGYKIAKELLWWKLKVKNPFAGLDEAALIYAVFDKVAKKEASEKLSDEDRAKIKPLTEDQREAIKAVLAA